MSFPVVEIKCSNRDVVKNADVLEYRPERLKVVVHGTDTAINMSKQGNIYVGNMAGLEFTCSATFNEIDEQVNPAG